jgi:hypothetical protein
VLDIGRRSDVANLGLMLSEAKLIRARLQQAVVAVQTDDHRVCVRFVRLAVMHTTSRTGAFIG